MPVNKWSTFSKHQSVPGQKPFKQEQIFVCVQQLLYSVWKMYPYVYSQIMFTCKEMHTRFMDAIEHSQSYHYE